VPILPGVRAALGLAFNAADGFPRPDMDAVSASVDVAAAARASQAALVA
jgi:hypothetical protein